MTIIRDPSSAGLQALVEVTRLVRVCDDLPEILAGIARTTSERLGWAIVAVNLYRPAWDDLAVATVHGPRAARDLLLGEAYGWDTWMPSLDARFERRGAYFLPRGEFDWSKDGITFFRPDIEPSDHPDAWHPDDALLVPLCGFDGRMLGIVSVDDPDSGRMPTDGELDVLVALCAHAALAVEDAQDRARAAHHRAALEGLLEISTRLTETLQVETVLDSICQGIDEVLGFHNVAVTLLDPDTGLVPARAARGWALDGPVLTRPFALVDIGLLLDPEFEARGCYLVPGDAARCRLGPRATGSTATEPRGRGPHAWGHHWLLVPLYDREGATVGFIWADDPEDGLLPSPERLGVLRAFANQATTAVDSAASFEEMRFLADNDSLTRLLNRRAFLRRIEGEAARAGRYGQAFSIVVGDLDELKRLNDVHGHAVGDQALQWFAGVLAEALRRSDDAFRIGGDEFAMILVEATADDVREVVDRVQAGMREHPDPRLAGLRASFGVAQARDGSTPEELLEAADEAMYQAKRAADGLRFAG